MPKIIKDLEEKLLAEAQRQIEDQGYGAMTVRSVAKACGVGVGTVYNYFPSKDDLVATYMLADWKNCIAAIEAVSTYSESHKSVVRCIHDQLLQYADRHMSLFRDEAAATTFAGTFSPRHAKLRSQLAAPLRKFCDSDFTAEFVAEALLTWTMAGKPLDEICGILDRLF